MELSGFVAGPYKTNSYLLSDKGRGVVIDPGMHAAARVDSWLEDNNLELDAIVLTHGHLDHTREAGDLARKYNVPVYIHAQDEFMLKDGSGVSQQSQILFNAADMVPIADLRYLVEGEVIDIVGKKFQVLHCPGHSPGSVVLLGEGIGICGDVVFKGSIGRTDLPQSNHEDMESSLRKLLDNVADDVLFLPGHGPTTTMRNERMTNPFLLDLSQGRLN